MTQEDFCKKLFENEFKLCDDKTQIIKCFRRNFIKESYIFNFKIDIYKKNFCISHISVEIFKPKLKLESNAPVFELFGYNKFYDFNFDLTKLFDFMDAILKLIES